MIGKKQRYKGMLTRVWVFMLFCVPIQVLAQDTIFNIYKQKLEFLAKKDAIIAQNIANADTPKYKPKELKEKKNKGYNIELYTTNRMHMNVNEKGNKYMLKQAEVTEIKPDGNAVSIENELLKKSQNSMQLHQVANLYNKSKNMMKYAITGHIR